MKEIGRAIREFIRELMLECGYEIDFSEIDYITIIFRIQVFIFVIFIKNYIV